MVPLILVAQSHVSITDHLIAALIFRGLDALTTEENIVTAIHKVAPVVAKNIRIIRDELTQTSKGYGFAEMASIAVSLLSNFAHLVL